MPLHAFDESKLSSDVIACLHAASRGALLDLAAGLSQRDRAELAAACWRRAHFHEVGLALAAQCGRDQLVAALGTVIGETLFAQSCKHRDVVPQIASPRSKITLARSNAPRRIIDVDPDETVEAPPLSPDTVVA